MLRHLKSVNRQASFPDLVLASLFAAGVTIDVPLAAGLRNPALLTPYEAVRELLDEYRPIKFPETPLAGSSRRSTSVASRRKQTWRALGRFLMLRTMFWIAVTHSSCQKAPVDSAAEVIPMGCTGPYRVLHHELGIGRVG
jgi:hypothetical protein